MSERSSAGGIDPRRQRVFVVRVWLEPGGNTLGAIRGSVVELESNRRFFFTQLGDLKDFLALRLAATDGGMP
jgi:hypothetical protein